MQKFGYVRVSTAEQCIDRQVDALLRAGVKEEFIFKEYRSGADFKRPVYREMLKRLKRGDRLIILSLDRLGRNYHEILHEWRKLREDYGIDIHILDMPVLNTGEDDSLTRKLISDIVLQLLSYVAQTEREFILKRQKEGIEAAKRRGVKFGRPALARPPEFELLKRRWLEREITAREAAQIIGVSHTTFLRWVKKA